MMSGWSIVRLFAVALSGLMVAPSASSASAQSLAEIARREEVRRQAVETPSKVYTNADLRGGGNLTTTVPPIPAGTEAETVPGAVAGTSGAPGEDAEPEEPPQDEEFWRARITAAREALSRNELFLEALQNRVDGLWADFTARDDPYQREEIAALRRDAMAEMERVQREIDGQTQAIADIEEEARRAGVPPGWLRYRSARRSSTRTRQQPVAKVQRGTETPLTKAALAPR